MIKSKGELKDCKYTNNAMSIGVSMGTDKYYKNCYIYICGIDRWRDRELLEFSLPYAKWIFRTLATILQAKVEVKVWCERCKGHGRVWKVKGASYWECPDCEGNGYREEEIARLK